MLTPADRERYSRHLVLREIGVAGQEKLKAARVLVLGAGGLGSPSALYLAASGVGTLGVIDFDKVDVSNLQRLVIYDAASVGTPKAGVFAEGAARTVAEILIARIKGGEPPVAFDGAGSCYLEFGRNQVGRVDVDFFSGASPTNMFNAPSAELSNEKQGFGQTRRTKWFGA
jgi:hypothetical protein